MTERVIHTIVTLKLRTDAGEDMLSTTQCDVSVTGFAVSERSVLEASVRQALASMREKGITPHHSVDASAPVVLFWKIMEDGV